MCCSGVKHIMDLSRSLLLSLSWFYVNVFFSVAFGLPSLRDATVHFLSIYFLINCISLLFFKPDVFFFYEPAAAEGGRCLLVSGGGSHGCINCS